MATSKSATTPTPASAVSASARGATFLILVQILSRAVTFLANQLLLRYLSPALLGAATQLELYSISVLYFARESLRVALQRQTSDVQAVINVSWIPIVLGLPLTGGLGLLYLRGAGGLGLVYLKEAVALYSIAALIELASEPWFAIVQMKMQYKVRAAAETTATIARCAVTFGVVVWTSRKGYEVGVLPFACGQLAYATTLLIVYVVGSMDAGSKDRHSLFPKSIANNTTSAQQPQPALLSLFPSQIITLSLNLTIQSITKYILTQSDSLLIAALTTLSTQGAYALAANYGGLIARLLFQPLEDTSRNLFAKLCSLSPTTHEPTQDGLIQAADALTLILKFYGLLSLAAWSIGPPLAPSLLRLVAGKRWTDTGAGDVLATYCYYIPLLALNGVTEAFVAATATTSELRTQSGLMAVWFAVFAGVAYFLLGVRGMGAEGLVWANCVNMGLRVAYNVSFIRAFFARWGAKWEMVKALPQVGSVTVAVAVGAILRSRMAVETGAEGAVLGQLLRAGAVVVAFVAILGISERRFVLHCWGMVQGLAAKDRKIKEKESVRGAAIGAHVQEDKKSL